MTRATWWLAVGLALGALAAGARAQSDAAPASAAAEPVPAADATVTLPLGEFEALVGAAQQARRSGAPAPWVLREARYACDATGPAVRVVATLAVQVLSDGPHAVTVGGGGVVFEKASVDDKDVLVVPGDGADRVAVLVSGRGEHAVSVAFAVPPSPDVPGARRLAFAVARAPMTRLTLVTEKAPKQIQPAGGAVVASRKAAKGHETEMLWPATEQVAVLWTDPVPAPVASASAAPPPVPRLEGHVSARYQFRADRLAIDAYAVFTVRQGAVRELKLAVPAGARFVRVRDAATDSTPAYALEKQTTRTVMVIRPKEPVTAEKRFHVEVEQSYPGPVPPAPSPATATTTGAAGVGPRAEHGAAAATGAASVPGAAGATSVPATAMATGAGTAPVLPVALPATSPTTGALSAAATTLATGVPLAGPPLAIPLAFLTMPEADASSGEITLVHPASPLALETPGEAKGSVTRVINVQVGVTGGPSFQYSGAPELTVALRTLAEQAHGGCEVHEARARTLLMPEGGSVTTMAWSLVNRREAALTVAVPQDAQVMSAFLDSEAVRVGDRGSAGPGVAVRLGLPSPVPAAWGDDPLSAGPTGARTATAATTGAGPTGAALGGTAVTPPAAAVAWRELVLPLRQDPQRTWTLELVYRQKGAPLGHRDHLGLRLPRTPVDVTRLTWNVDVPAGFSAWVESDQLKESERVERRSEPIGGATTAAATMRPLESRAAAAPATGPAAYTMASVGSVRFDVPEGGNFTRYPLLGDGVKAGAAIGCQVSYVSQALQQWAGALVFCLTLVLLSDLYWFSFGSMVLALAGVLLLGTLLICAVLTLGVMTHLLAGLVAGLTFKLIRLVVEPAEERETT